MTSEEPPATSWESRGGLLGGAGEGAEGSAIGSHASLSSEVLETYRAYLLLIANRELSPALRTLVGASDLVQDSLIEAQQSIADFAGEGEGQFLAWLRRILLNNLADAARKHGRAIGRTVTLDRALDGNSSSERPLDRLAVDSESPSQALRLAEERSQLNDALQRLPQELREVVQLRNFELLTFEQIGERLGRHAGTVCRTWYKAIGQLQRELGDTRDGGS